MTEVEIRSRRLAQALDDVTIMAMHSDFDGARSALEIAREMGLEAAKDDWERDEVECRYLERKLFLVSSIPGAMVEFAEIVEEIGRSARFTAERLHHVCTMAGVYLQDMAVRDFGLTKEGRAID